MWSLIKKRRKVKKPVGVNNIALCSEIRECLLQWDRKAINTANIWTRIRTEIVPLVEQTNRYLRLVLQIQRAIISDSEPNPHFYVLLYQSIAHQFMGVEFKRVGFQRKLDVFESKEKNYITNWIRPVLVRNYQFRRMPFGKLKDLLQDLRQGKEIAAEFLEEIRNLEEEMDEMKAEVNSDIRDCIRRAEDLLSRIQLGKGIGEE